jgi:hypothetical protein
MMNCLTSTFENLPFDISIGKHCGKRGFVVGGGASIGALLDEGFEPSVLDTEIVVGANKAYKFCRLSYFASVDPSFIQRFSAEINLLDCVKFIPERYEQGLLVNSVVKLPDPKLRHKRSTLPTGFLTMSHVGGSGTFAIRVAYLLGLNPIYLIGFDCTRLHGKSHFHNDYPKPLLEEQAKAFYLALATLVDNLSKNVAIYSCSSISLLNARIPYIPLREVVAHATNSK